MWFMLLPAMALEALEYTCPFCDSQVRVGKPCPGCAKKPVSKKTPASPWEPSEDHGGLDLPAEDDFDYHEFVAREFGKSPHRQTGLKWYWWTLAVALILAMLGSLFLTR